MANFNLFDDLNRIKSHKKAIILKSQDKIEITYKGSLKSAGFRFLMKTTPNVQYELNVEAELISGDMAFVYCESVNPNKRLIERKYYITKTLNNYKINFTTLSSQTYLGILFFNENQEYKLIVKRFEILLLDKSPEEETALDPLINDFRKKLQKVKKNKEELLQIINKNNHIAQEILKESFNKNNMYDMEMSNLDKNISNYFTNINSEIEPCIQEADQETKEESESETPIQEPEKDAVAEPTEAESRTRY